MEKRVVNEVLRVASGAVYVVLSRHPINDAPILRLRWHFPQAGSLPRRSAAEPQDRA
jgi:hypothetical protein